MSTSTGIHAQAGQLGDLVRDVLIAKAESGEITEEMLAEVLKNPDIFQGKALTAALQVACMGSLVDNELFEPVTLVTVAGAESFDPATFFKNNQDEQPDKIKFWLGDSDFTDNFLGKAETNIPAITLRTHKLKEDANDAQIIPALGGEEIVETTLHHFYEMLKKQPNGEDGTLLTDGKGNIFYIRDANSTLWAVGCHWISDEWGVYAVPVTDRVKWYAGHQIFSR